MILWGGAAAAFSTLYDPSSAVFLKSWRFKDIKSEISEKHLSTLETRKRISHIQSRTSRREREFLSPNLMLRDKTENNFLLSQAWRRDWDLFFSISDYETRREFFNLFSVFETRTRIFNIAISPREIRFCPTFLHAILVKFFLSDPGVPGVQRISLQHALHFAFPKYCQTRLWFFTSALTMR